MAKEQIDPKEMYMQHCEGRFDEISTGVTRLTAIVTNGLSHRVVRIERLMYAVAGATILTLATFIFQLVTK